MRLRSLTFALMLAVGALTPAMAATPAAEAFDEAVASGQPSFDLMFEGTTYRLTGLERLDVELEGPDGMPGTMFTALADGRPASIVRLGDEIDLTFDDEESSQDRPGTAGIAARSMPAHALDDVLRANNDEPPARDDGRPGEGLNVYVYLHENAKEHDQAKFLNWYLTWWFSEMKRHIVPEKHVRIFLRGPVPGLTDMNMNEGTRTDHLRQIHLRGFQHLLDTVGDAPGMSRFLLVVGPVPASWGPNVMGLADERGKSAMVSNRGHRHGVAHELGHTIGAMHEDSKSFPCASSMADFHFGIISCRSYTDKNRQNIRDYLLPRL